MNDDDEVYRPGEMRQGYDKPPIPYIETMAKGEFWCPDYYDQAIPTQKGFITDFIYYTRGFETPTLSVIWTALFILSSAIKREAWFQWAPDGLYTNQYIIIIGPAGIVKKTTAVSVIGLPILRKFRYWIKDKNIYAMKSITIIKDKTTPEAMLSALVPENKDGQDVYLVDEAGEFILDKRGKAIQYRKTSEAALVVSELSSMLGKASYSEAMIPNLLDLYDAHKEWDWSTLTRGKQTLRNLHTTLLAGTTVDGLRGSIPASAMGDGFLSRTIPVYVPDTKRCFRKPFIPKNGPTEDELAKRLAWVASTCIGEFQLTKEADEYMEEWYKNFKEFLRNNPTISGSMSRMDVNVYKTALLMRAQRYNDKAPFITKEDLLNAIKLLTLTYSSFPFLRSQINPDELVSWSAKLGEFIRKKGKTTRVVILRSLHIKSELATLVLEELIAKGDIQVYWDNNRVPHATTRSEEEYEWTGQRDRSISSGQTWEGSSIGNFETLRDDQTSGAGFGSEPYEPETVHKKGRPAKPKRPSVRREPTEETNIQEPLKPKGRPRKVAK